ncbi:homoserine dehydrogenase [Anaerocolumna cellulosilytica]|uniref:Homoserine dehydrogenase n=1 Tax=Anaerocolumna cellulosilytica TaxID=433286 RepID=A0A6S6RCA1_9FIRM|nr:homoserine dehydrogenase [Anaerocolumna cellulosilytica]MBB5195154.1 homoserine dehydrogenase [Anaerocolumna cellulosilytica]BCJ96625.1 homoserine dehydrogenase [Anaerocolumna cellulosilytica]
MVNIAVLGYGTVGSGVVEVLNVNGDSINKRCGHEIQVKYVLDLRDFPGDPIQDKIVHNYETIVNDPEVGIIVEVMGGVEPAYTFVKEAILKGKSVCTSNKELVAKHGAELLKLSKQMNVNFLFEASVGGGIPIIRPLNQSLTADEIEEITGILNGTTNYILTKMSNEGSDFNSVLKEAQAMGYAERNPQADIEGYDACRKIAILSSLAFGMQVDFEDIYTEGITKITEADIKYAKAMGASIKLLGSSKKEQDHVYAMVAPMLIKPSHPLFSVNDVFNGIFVRGNVIGDVMFYGSGAGKLPTASAVVADVVDAAKHIGTNIMTLWSSKKLELSDIKRATHRFFVRVAANDEKTKEQIAMEFGQVDVIAVPDMKEEYAFITMPMSEETYQQKAEKFKNIVSMIRVNF